MNTAINPEIIPEIREVIAQKWQAGYDKSAKLQPSVGEYRKVMEYGYLGSLDYLVSKIDKNGMLNVEAAKQARKDDPGFREDLFDTAVEHLGQFWPNSILEYLSQIGS